MTKNCGPGKHKGNPCRVCGARGRGRPPGKKSAAKPSPAPARKKLQAGEAVSARLAGTLGVAAPAPAPTLGAQGPAALFGGEPTAPPAAPPPPGPALPPPPDTLEPLPPEVPTWCKSAGKRFAQLFVAANDWAAEKLKPKRKLNDPDDDDVEAFGKSAGDSLAHWFPDSELSPVKQMLISGAFITGAMWIGSEKLPPEREAIVDESKSDGPNGARVADSTSNVTPLHA